MLFINRIICIDINVIGNYIVNIKHFSQGIGEHGYTKLYK